jgi:outer membrane protein OmpA-like peptidoglycan-associated protein
VTPFLTVPVAKLGALLMAFLACDLRAPVQVSASAAVLEAREHAAARRAQTLVAAKACGQEPVENGAAVRIAFFVNSADLTEAGWNALSAASARLACAPELAALVVSQGDPHRLASYRREVAERRAEAIAAYFGGDGVSEGRIVRAPRQDGSPIKADRVILIEAMGPDV